MKDKKLEFWFGYGSTYTYLSVMRIQALLTPSNVELVWRPFNLTTLMRQKGLPRGPFADRPEKLAYMWRDLERRAKFLGIPYRQPTVYPVDSQRTVRVGVLARREGWCAEFTRKVLLMNFNEGRAIGVPGNLEAALDSLGFDADSVIQRAHQPDVEAELERQTERAIALGIFGSPTFLVGDELFWGDDRLEDAIAWAAERAAEPD